MEQLTPRVYVELRRAASQYMRHENIGNSLQATALVHEVYLQLVNLAGVSCQNRAHFFAVSANMMRRILVDQARAKGVAKRGGGTLQLNLEEALEVSSGSKDREIVAIDEALDALAAIDPRKAKVVEFRFFGGRA